ncbi:MAG: MobC family plasmid mobilization relaxosome protein [Paludibacteraceae bacterium]|nr:MobC family plasmid mobilization relaxosome protein [Paludibacteraceae bacterium]
MSNSTKEYRLHVRLNESQYNDFLSSFENSHYPTKSAYICHLLHNTKVVQLPLFGENDILNELKDFNRQIDGIANNVNQISRHLNQTKTESVLGYSVAKMLEILPKVADLQKEMNQKIDFLTKKYIETLEKI